MAQRQILGQGSFGCVLTPKIQCKSPNASITKLNDDDNNVRTASKLLIESGVTDRNIEYYRNKFKTEIHIATKLLQIDPNNVYFLGGDNFCAFKKSDVTNINTKNDIDNCAKKSHKNKTINEDNFVFNIEMKLAYPFEPIVNMLSIGPIVHMFAHLVVGIHQLATKTSYLFMDIKMDNVLIHTFQNRLYYPVFIDFSPTHVITDKSSHNIFNYASSFSAYDYDVWPPEIKSAILLMNLLRMLENKSLANYKEEYRQLAADFKEELDPNIRISYKTTFDKIADIIVKLQKKQFKSLPAKIKKQLMMFSDEIMAKKNIMYSIEYFILPEIQKEESSYALAVNMREKIMIWQLARLFLEIVASKPNNQPFVNILIKCLLDNAEQRPNCINVLNMLHKMVPKIIKSKSNNLQNNKQYMLKLEKPITLDMLKYASKASNEIETINIAL